MVQWTGPALQVQVLPWTLLKDATTAHAFAAAIAVTPRRLFSGGTSISGAIDYAVPLLLESEFKGTRRVIDISGDGSNNRGRPAASARDNAVRAGIIINGLPILALEPDLDSYYSDHVIGGPGAFVIVAESYETFADAILKKLIREMAAHEQRPPARWPPSRPPCTLPRPGDSMCSAPVRIARPDRESVRVRPELLLLQFCWPVCFSGQ
jgi:hypothetical protein